MITDVKMFQWFFSFFLRIDNNKRNIYILYIHIFIYIYYIYKKKEICLVKNKENVMFFIRQMSHFHTVKNMSQSVLDWPLVIFTPWKIKNVKTSHSNCCTSITSIGGSVVEFSPATRETGVRFPANANFFISNTYQVLCKFFSSNRWLGKMLNIFVICQVFFIANSKQTADSDSFLFHTILHCMVVTKIRTLVYITTNRSIQKKNVKKENWIVLVTRQIQMII